MPVCMQDAFNTQVPVGTDAAVALSAAKDLFDAYIRDATYVKSIGQLILPEYRAQYTEQAKGSYLPYHDILEIEKRKHGFEFHHRQVISFYPGRAYDPLVPVHLTNDAGQQLAAYVSCNPGCSVLRRKQTAAQKAEQLQNQVAGGVHVVCGVYRGAEGLSRRVRSAR